MNSECICRYRYCDKHTLENEQYCSSECMDKEEKRIENKTRVGTRKQRGNSTKVKCANPACKNKTTNLKWCCTTCYTIVNNAINLKRKREETKNKPKKFNFKCHYEKCDELVSTNHPMHRFHSPKCKKKQDLIEEKAHKKKMREVESKTKKLYKEEVVKQVIIKEKGISCSTIDCKGDTWRKGGYCAECQRKGLMKPIKNRTYRTGISAITQGN